MLGFAKTFIKGYRVTGHSIDRSFKYPVVQIYCMLFQVHKATSSYKAMESKVDGKEGEFDRWSRRIGVNNGSTVTSHYLCTPEIHSI